MIHQHIKWNDIENTPVRRRKPNSRRGAFFGSLQEAAGTDAPAIAGFQPRKLELRARGSEVVADVLRVSEKLRSQHDTHRVAARVRSTGVARTITKEARERLG